MNRAALATSVSVGDALHGIVGGVALGRFLRCDAEFLGHVGATPCRGKRGPSTMPGAILLTLIP